MLKTTRKIILCTAVVLTSATACVPDSNDYSEFVNMPESRWLYSEPVEFTPEPADTNTTGQLTVAIRHTRGYAYRNLWLEVSHTDANGQNIIDTLNMELADIYGTWHGTGLGTDFQMTDTLPRTISLRKGKPVRVRHIMRTDTLAEIEQVGILFKADRQDK
ncbi:MAG: gliding motility lipoprotein GldH [Muribaculaceae bacterium]|nr:gliding motility lipoprotein GldH [Muribaculaceae bacterium]